MIAMSESYQTAGNQLPIRIDFATFKAIQASCWKARYIISSAAEHSEQEADLSIYVYGRKEWDSPRLVKREAAMTTLTGCGTMKGVFE